MTETSGLFAQYPPRWEIYDWYKDHVPAHIMGFALGHGDVVRFGARYRFANSFRGIDLEDVSARTLEAYSRLAHLMFTYGAFETFLKIQGFTNDTYESHLRRYPTADWLADVRETDQGDTLVRFCKSVATGRRVVRELDAYIAGKPASFVYVAYAVRNAFAHGHLTGQVWGSSPNVVRQCARTITMGLLTVMHTEWDRLMTDLEEEMESIFSPPDDDHYSAWDSL